MTKFVFGVMSNKWSLEADDEDIAMIAMSIFIGKDVPIAIYSPEEKAFSPKEILEQALEVEKQPLKDRVDNTDFAVDTYPREKVKGCLKTIKVMED